MTKKNQYNMKLIDTLYNQVPAFTDVFDEDTWYIFAGCVAGAAFVLAFLVSRFVTIKPVD